MKLGNVRLCAEPDCEEVYEATGLYSKCPACGSEAFALISRWIPTSKDFERWVEEQKQKEAEGVRAPSACAT